MMEKNARIIKKNKLDPGCYFLITKKTGEEILVLTRKGLLKMIERQGK